MTDRWRTARLIALGLLACVAGLVGAVVMAGAALVVLLPPSGHIDGPVTVIDRQPPPPRPAAPDPRAAEIRRIAESDVADYAEPAAPATVTDPRVDPSGWCLERFLDHDLHGRNGPLRPDDQVAYVRACLLAVSDLP
jgi:hypothetical protein